MRSRTAWLGAALAAPLTVAGLALASGTALAAPTSVTAHTHVVNRPDGGNGGTWAYDDFTRTLTVKVAAVQNPADTAAHLTDYTATITDHGQFHAIIGVLAPNQAVPGVKITRSVSGEMDGHYSLTLTAPSTDTLAGTVPAYEDDNFSAPANTTTNWPKLAFASPTGVTVSGGAYNWTYQAQCETWVDSSANGDGNLAGDGNITGKSCHPVRRDRDDHGHRR